MNKRKLGGIVSAGLLTLGIIGGASNGSQPPVTTNTQSIKGAQTIQLKPQATPVAKPTCDGTAATTTCVADGMNYKTYVYHQAVAEKTHTQSVTTYKEEITGYCTLCSDGSFSPSCATGRGACSHHGGVQQWNAPRVSQVPVVSETLVVDAPAQPAYFEKVVE